MIGYVYYYDQPHHSIPGVSDSLVKSSAAWGNLIGQLMFGYLADKFGRKKIYGLEVICNKNKNYLNSNKKKFIIL